MQAFPDQGSIYASRETGLLVTEENLDKLPEGAIRGVERALAEYDGLIGRYPS